MNPLDTAFDRFSKREATKRGIYAVSSLVISGGIMVAMVIRPVHPAAANLPTALPALVFLAIGFDNLRALVAKRAEPVRDQRFLANLLWMAAILGFASLVLVAIEVNAQPQGGTDALLCTFTGLALLIVASVFKIVTAVNEAELRLRESFLAIHETR